VPCRGPLVGLGLAARPVKEPLDFLALAVFAPVGPLAFVVSNTLATH